MKLPKARSEEWLSILISVFLGNLIATLGSRYILQQNITFQNVVGFVVLAMIVTLVVCVGYFGAMYWVSSVLIANLIAILYLFYSVTFNISDGWTDLVSLFSYLTILAVGFVVGLIVQVVVWVGPKLKK